MQNLNKYLNIEVEVIVVVVVVVMGARSELLRKPRPGKESLPGGRARVHPRTLCSSHGIPGSQQWK